MSHLSLVSPTPDLPPLAIGETLGVYVIERVLGEGSMGRVYLGRHQRLGRQVALKVLHDSLLRDQRLVKRFMQEGRVVNQINHEHIVEVHDFVEELAPERVYCVMELLKGETLTSRLAARPVSLDSVRAIVRETASALGAAHAVGVVHRDVKPDNIFLLSRDGRDDWVKVLDFGVAKSTPEGSLNLVESQQGTLLGTPRYMAPEQVAGLEVDARTDIYALGTILYELLAGRPPFDASTFGQLAADIITRPPPPLPKQNALGETIPPAMVALTLACLAKKPNDRPASMAAVEAALLNEDSGLGRKVGMVAVGLLAVVAGVLLVLALKPKPDPTPTPVVAVAPPVEALPPPPPPPTELAEVTLTVDTQPSGAKLIRRDTGELLGTTPFERKLGKAELLPLRIELAGHQPLERDLKLDQSQRLDMTLKPLPSKSSKAPPRPVTDGVLDPY
ncbi:MAG: serine/threonine-protein kinase [Myxococcota bacterium]